jgi:hypothetical protein
MRRIGNTIHCQQSSWNLMHNVRNGFDVIYGTEDIAAMCAGDQACPVGQEAS